MKLTRPSRRPRLRWGAAVAAGVIAGAAFMTVQTILVPAALDGSPWAPSRMIAAILMGPHVLLAPIVFDPVVSLTAMVLHFALSGIYGILIAALVTGLNRPRPILIGLGFGLFLYIVNFYGFTHLFPWFAAARSWVTVTSHLVFGLVAVWAYDALRGPPYIDLVPYDRTTARRAGRRPARPASA